MRTQRKRRMIFVLLMLAAVGIAATLTAFALSRNMNYLFTPSQVLSGAAKAHHTFRLGGMVKAGSIKHAPDSLTVDFTVVDAGGSMPVRYTGVLPDLFRANQSVITTGHMVGNHFVATKVLAKHDATYMPRELKQAMAKAHAAKHVHTTAATTGAGS